MSHFENKLSEEQIFNGRVVKLSRHMVELENGSVVSREVISHPGGVAVVAIDDSDNLLMVRQFRYAAGQELLELPAGKLNFGEDPLECGHRELMEETGFCSNDLTLLTKFYPTPAYCSEIIYIYYTNNLLPSTQNLDPDEFLTVEAIPFSKALEMVKNGEIIDGKTQIGILSLAAIRGNI